MFRFSSLFQFCFFWCLPVLALQLIRRLEELRQNSKKPFLPKRPSLSYQIVLDGALIYHCCPHWIISCLGFGCCSLIALDGCDEGCSHHHRLKNLLCIYFQNVYYGFGCNGDDNDGRYLHNIVVQFALSSICGRPADQGKQDALTILTHEHDDDEDFRKVRVVKPKSGSGK